MTGGLINIISYGTNDLYLTGAPEITLFKVVHRRYTNFSKESIQIRLPNLDFGKTVEIEIPKIADLISTTYLQIDLPQVNILKTDQVSDITNTEETILTTPYTIPKPTYTNNNNDVIEMDFITDYNTFKTYMIVNTQGYISALNNSSIMNQTVVQYINTIIDDINSVASNYPGIIVFFNDIINNAYNYEISLNNIYDASCLIFSISDILYILNLILNAINNNLPIYNFTDPNTITINDVLNIIKNAINNCKKIDNYYFNKVNDINNKNKETNSLYAKFAWVQKLGHAIIDYIEVNIGGETIDKHYGDWINIWYELTHDGNQVELYNKMIGNVKEMTTFDSNAKPQYSLLIPLTFWFSKFNGLSFPIISLQFNKFYITVKLKNLEDCAYIEKLPTLDQNNNPIDFSDNTLGLTDIWNNLNYSINSANLLIDYVYLDTMERRRFAQSSHEYLIETIEKNEFININDNKQNIEFNFNGSCKEIFFICQKDAYTDNYNTDVNKSNLKCFWFNYTTSTDENIKQNPFSDIKLTFNGYDRFIAQNGNMTNYLNPYKYHTSSPDIGINVISFSLFPEEHQPSGSCNFTRITQPKLKFNINNNMFSYNLSDIDPSIIKGSEQDETFETTVNIRIYSLKINILRISHGRSALAYH